ncbi:hypothetical protein K7432_009771 [Basidiobolus ranarum]|uniref:Extracellular membrane protein CFEM domain-containing protein n=1 Tax=Basidiobolus ranarum TaxID=34480 RepID=A0ABR2VWJ3_9FUNG
MKSIFLFLVAIVSVTHAAICFAPELLPNTTCPPLSVASYNQCRSNALSSDCSHNDTLCNCREARYLVACINMCQQDPHVYDYITYQKQEVEKWCSGIPSSILNPPQTSTSTAVSSSQTGVSSSGNSNGNSNGSSNVNILSSANSLHSTHIVGVAAVLIGTVGLTI